MASFEERLSHYDSPLEVLGPLQEIVTALQFHSQELRLRSLVLPLLRLLKEDFSEVKLWTLRALDLILEINEQHVEYMTQENGIRSLCAVPLQPADEDLTEEAFKWLASLLFLV